MRYIVQKTNMTDPDAYSAEWEIADIGRISEQNWHGYCTSPETIFKMLRGPEGISILMHTKEKNLRSQCTLQNGEVCRDSCMEFFFKPNPWDERYINFEINPDGVMHVGIGVNRYGRVLDDTDRAVFNVQSVPNDGDWILKFYIPDLFLLTHFEKIAKVCKANFYKCGNDTDHPHYGAWSPVEVERPDFHLPDFFGTIEFA